MARLSMNLKRVISGGQTGADQAGLRAAKIFGLETGGWLPKGCRTLDGPRFDLLTDFNMVEHISSSYAPRTEANVRDSDATIRFATTFSSAGEICTKKAINWYKKPSKSINTNNPIDVAEIALWIKENNFETLNVAGNSEETSPGIGDFVFDYLLEVFSKLT